MRTGGLFNIVLFLSAMFILSSCTQETNYAPTTHYQNKEVEVFDTIIEPSDTIEKQNITVATNTSDLPNVSLQVTPTDSATITLKEATLSVPIGAVDHSITLSITNLNDSDLPRLPQGMVNVTRNAPAFRFLPHGEHFTNAPAHIT